MSGEVPKSVWQGSFLIFGVEVKCHVLDNGRRIIEEESFDRLCDALASDNPGEIGDLAEFNQWRKGSVS